MTDVRALDPRSLRPVVAEQPHPLVFATVSGAHLYGFPSVDSDVDLRGAHVLPPEEVVGLRTGPQTLDRSEHRDGLEMDLVTHDVAKFARLLLRRNGYVLEQLLSPLVVTSSAAHAEMAALAPACLTRSHAHHYLGFARGQADLFIATQRLKPLLYTVRVLLTGVHLMRTGEVQAHLPTLLSLVPEAPEWTEEALQRKASAERGPVGGVVDADTALAAVARLAALLEGERERSALPVAPTAEPALHDLVVRVRLHGLAPP